MFLPNVDSRTRTYLLDEFQRDVNAGRLHVPMDLTKEGTGDWPVLLQLTLMESGPDALAQHLRHRGRMRDPRKAIALAHAEYRRLYCRAICRRAIDDGQPEVQVIGPKQGGPARIEARSLLGALRAFPDTPAGLPGLPNTEAVVAIPDVNSDVNQKSTLAA
ncbi:MAG: hypothetical protein AAGA48_33895 [Myxococcota bacterium]